MTAGIEPGFRAEVFEAADVPEGEGGECIHVLVEGDDAVSPYRQLQLQAVYLVACVALAELPPLVIDADGHAVGPQSEV